MHKLVLCGATLMFAGFALAQSYAQGPQVLTFLSDVDDTDQPYALYLPKGFDPARKYPLVISLHGAYSNHRLNLRRVFGKSNLPDESDAAASRYFPAWREVPYIVASPFARGTMGYQGIAERDVYDVLADVKKRFRIDEDRVYLTGLSMGGGGTLWLGLTRPDVWAAIAPVCPYPPPGTDELAPNALNLPVHLFHGEQDPVVPVTVSRNWQKRLLDLETKVEYIEYPNVRHNSWENAYRNGGVFDWFGQFRRNRFPDRVRFSTRSYSYDRAYWVRIDSLTPGDLASIDARFAASAEIQVATTGLDGFTLRLEGHPKVAPKRPLRVIVDGAFKLDTKAAAELSFTRAGGKWQAGLNAPPPGAKRKGLEGPIPQAIAERHVYVFGTAGAEDRAEITRRREIAAQAAEWSTPALRLLVNHRVAADRDLTEADAKAAALVLFGDRRSNGVIARLADRLPLELNPGAADYGLVFVAPVDGKYVVVNSGLPFWTGKEQAQRFALDLLDANYALMSTFGDYILFKGSVANVVAEGRFDNHWKLPAEARAKLEASGVVTIR